MTSHTLVLLNCFEKPRRTYVSHLLKDLSVSMSNLSYYLFAVVHFLGSNCEQLSHHIYNVMFCFTLHWPYAWWPKRKKKKTKNCFQQNVFFFLTSENVCFYLYNHFFSLFCVRKWRLEGGSAAVIASSHAGGARTHISDVWAITHARASGDAKLQPRKRDYAHYGSPRARR